LKARDRRREEDPFTDIWASIVPTRMVMHRSRFEVDINRPRDHAVYRNPQDAWGLDVWKTPADEQLIADSLVIYDSFYEQMQRILEDLEQRYGCFVLLDLHNYNFKRSGIDGPEDDPALNPEINIGTDGMPRERWSPLLDAFIDGLRSHEYRGRPLDVRENVRFKGGHLAHWVHGKFTNGCAIAVEVKKFFMDEWTGRPTPGGVDAVARSLETAVSSVRRQLEK
jgi:N-formylglutamate amidohydrolase